MHAGNCTRDADPREGMVYGGTMKELYDILVVDDEQVVIDSAKKILLSEGYLVDTVPDAESAIQRLHGREYKMIITDLMLPRMSGLEFIGIVKKMYSQIVLVMITGYGTLENAVASFTQGVFDYIPKPFSLDELLGVVSRAVKYSEMATVEEKNNFIGIPDAFGRISGYYFMGKHSWARKERDESYSIGPGMAFSRVIKDVTEITLPSFNDEIIQGRPCGHLISGDRLIHTVWSPLSGKVIGRNGDLEKDPALIVSDPFEAGWLARIIPSNTEMELKNLFSLDSRRD